jgi:hypothetical protein
MVRWEDNIKMDVKEIEWEVLDWILVDQNVKKLYGVVNRVP